MSKVPEITWHFWVTKVAATTLGETAGDAVSMSMGLGYLVGSAIFGVIFLLVVGAQVASERFRPFLYWTTIVATTTVGTTLADFADRSLGIGYAGGTSLLFALLIGSLALWRYVLGSVPTAGPASRGPRCSGRPSSSRGHSVPWSATSWTSRSKPAGLH